MFNSIDANCDGKIDIEEWEAAFDERPHVLAPESIFPHEQSQAAQLLTRRRVRARNPFTTAQVDADASFSERALLRSPVPWQVHVEHTTKHSTATSAPLEGDFLSRSLATTRAELGSICARIKTRAAKKTHGRNGQWLTMTWYQKANTSTYRTPIIISMHSRLPAVLSHGNAHESKAMLHTVDIVSFQEVITMMGCRLRSNPEATAVLSVLQSRAVQQEGASESQQQ